MRNKIGAAEDSLKFFRGFHGAKKDYINEAFNEEFERLKTFSNKGSDVSPLSMEDFSKDSGNVSSTRM